tara:strand:- start:10638 stop:10919 length:282 start_codon:yes stop_codon:yes gene_type:complete
LVEPYYDITVKDNEWIRMFSEEVDNDEMVWHRDKKDREIRVMYSKGDWKFQRDNEIPFIINTSSKFNIDAMVYHRLIKGSGPLVLRIKETEGV